MPNFPVSLVAWSDVARACRRVCLLRERGQSEEAEQLRSGPLAALVAAVRTPTETDAEIAARLESLFAQEGERVATAAVVAELLLPLLAEQLRAFNGPSVVKSSAAFPAALPPRATPAPAASIADYIDMMIEQEKLPGRAGPVSQRQLP